MKEIIGVPGSPGFADGKPTWIEPQNQSGRGREVPIAANQVESEIEKLKSAIQKSIEDLQELQQKSKDGDDQQGAEILEAHLQMTDDPEALDQSVILIRERHLSAATCYAIVIDQFINSLAQSDDDYLKARVTDLRDISDRILHYITSPEKKYQTLQLTEPSIVIAQDLTPSQVLSWGKKWIKALVLEKGGTASHVSILARSLEIPAVVGVGSALAELRQAKFLYVDGTAGKVLTDPSAEQIQALAIKQQAYQKKMEQLSVFRDQKTSTLDGHHITLAANISGPQDLEAVTKNGAEGVGLYRTEFLYLDRNSAPSEEEQYKIYRQVFASPMRGKVIIRTLDAGGDKELHYLHLPPEENPFLGVRAIRLCLKEKELFKTQLRALLRAAVGADWGIMFPMVSQLEEITASREILNEVKAELKTKGVPYSDRFDFGVMIEVPTMAFMMDILAGQVDFVSFGTNDLLQYSTASDRMSPDLQNIYNPFNPGFLRMVHHAITTAKAHRIHVGICGSLAHHDQIAPFLAGCGADELSMSAQHILAMREKVGRWNMNTLQKLVTQTLSAKTCQEAKQILSGLDK